MAAACFKETINSLRYPVPQEYEAVPQRHCYPHNYLDDTLLTTTPERLLCCLRRVKTYLRSTMQAERLSGLALLYAYMGMSVDTDKRVRKFCAKKPRRLAFEF